MRFLLLELSNGHSQWGKPGRAVEPWGLAGPGRWRSLSGEVQPFGGAERVPLKHKLTFPAASWAEQSDIPTSGAVSLRGVLL